MTSAVLDAALCILLVSAAVVTVVDARRQATGPTVDQTTAPTDEQATDPGEIVALLSSVTATVSYRQSIESEGPRRDRPDDARLGATRHGTLAELLAYAAVHSVKAGGITLIASSDAVTRAVRTAVRRVVGRQTRIVARWSPVYGGHVAGKLSVGPRPPPEADVHAARLTVPVPTAAGGSAGTRRADGTESSHRTSARRVARRVAKLIVATLFPPDRTRSVLFESDRRARFVGGQYDRVGGVYGIDDATPATADRVPTANSRLVDAIAGRLVTDFARGDATSSPQSRVGVDHVTVVVRTWDG